jgi:hypothetical protein
LNIELGLSNRDAMAMAGVSESAFYEWIQRGNAELARVAEAPGRRKIQESERIFVEFAESIKQAIPKRKHALITRIRQAAQGGEQYTETREKYEKGVLVEKTVTVKAMSAQWQAAAWLLERMHYHEFGQRQRLDIHDWRKEVKELLDSGAITPEDIESELGPDVAKEFFESAGLHYVGSGPAEAES